ncbi:(d)CMP kinase [Ornithinicoccus hortensis]|uniref:Cytidylate kinase n=1 Tax=Ornithinicoccus hortensis TaxID=82346 RepID=A0A542YTK7_9MICO|nr:(d)CMP kinase [Ornithinicoccus hortensis]TQL51284.1 cytidylate kinase [Ornithinicoccus hortensis]
MSQPLEPPVTIAIDGPSGSGKSSVSKAVARELGLTYLDTGAMFRALALWCVREGIDLADQDAVEQASRTFPLEMGTDPAAPAVHLAGADVGPDIRTQEVSAVVSRVATNLGVRAVLRELQRDLIRQARETGPGIVVEGRDITTVIAPDAEVRVLLTASEEARLARRAKELYDTADAQALAATHDLVVRRDQDDATVSAFFEPADGVVGIDTSSLTFAQSVAAVLDVARSAAPQDQQTPDGGDR